MWRVLRLRRSIWGRGRVKLLMQVPGNLLYEIISERTGLDIDSEAGLMPCVIELTPNEAGL